MIRSKQPDNAMVKFILILGFFAAMNSLRAQEGRSTYYYQRVGHFTSLPAPEGVVFLGNSITDGAEWQELFLEIDLVNRGISGDGTGGMLARLAEIIRQRPAKLFLMAGINDLAAGIPAGQVIQNIRTLVDSVRCYSPYTAVYVQSLLPVNDTFEKFRQHTAQKKAILQVNNALKALAAEKGYTFVDLYPAFSDREGRLDTRYTNDGLHLTGEGYLLWKHLLYLHGLQQRPSVIPAPAQLAWGPGRFPMYKTREVRISAPSLKPLALALISRLPDDKVPLTVGAQRPGGYTIYLQLEETGGHGKEGYELLVGEDRILLKGQTLQGIFYGLQTLFQLMRDGTFVPACVISDQPAFAWRGLMHDLGRNYIPVDELKRQIDEMARYKLNVLHLHLTEDIAWRLGMEEYPALTVASNMERNAGMYYTMAELQSLVSYAGERYITLVPEIDMPGHSEAFTRAFGVSMQSEKGKELVKDILHKVNRALDTPYFHIGGDEVEITDTTFLPEMSQVVRKYGKQVIGWLPGGNLDKQVIRQLWASQKMPEGIRSIDSRHLYLNHNDPLGGIVKVFNRQLCGAGKGDSLRLGGEICIWPDRRPLDTRQIMVSNGIYPAMLAFAERSWQGGGYPDLAVTLGAAGSEQLVSFRAFENRLLDHKKLYFREKGFPYVKQGQARWKLAGPFDNQGVLTTAFAPETRAKFWEDPSLKEVFGSTLWLRHFFAFAMQGQSGYIRNPRENSTCYAYTEVYAPAEREVKMWISFHNPSRSEQDDTAPAGEWDYKKSRIWLNGTEISPPAWSKPGRKGEKEAPYIDESFEMRAPHSVTLREGWNKILVKVPVGQFTTAHTRLVKWMFTAAFIENSNGQWQEAQGIRYW